MKYTHIMKSIARVLTIAMVVVVSACGEEEVNRIKIPPNAVPIDASQTDREYLEETAKAFLGHFSPNDQRSALISLNKLLYLFENYSFPFDESSPDAAVAARGTQELIEDIEGCDIHGISRAAANYAFALSRYKGLYQANDKLQQWQYTENRDDVTFRFWISNDEYNLIIKDEDGVKTETFVKDGETYAVEIPKTLKVVLYSGSVMANKQLIYALINTDFKDNSQLKMTIEFTFANLLLQSTIKSTNTQLDEETTLFIDNTSNHYRTALVSTSTRYGGTSLCSLQAWLGGSSAPVFTTASSTMLIMERVQVKSKMNDMSLLDTIETGYMDKGAAESSVSRLKSGITAEVFYAGDDKVRATLGWEPYVVSDGTDYEVWGVRPTLTFRVDGATFDFKSFFGNNRFLSVENNYESLMKTYRTFWHYHI